MRLRRLAAAVSALMALACSAAPPADAQSCTTLGQTTFVRDTLDEYYFWYREMPKLSPALYPSPEAYLEAVRYKPIDTSYSYITSRASNDAFFSDSQTIAVGLLLRLVGQEYRVTEVFPDSPGSEAGLERGAWIFEINGRTIADYLAKGDLGSAFGPNEVGVTVSLRFRDRAGAERSATATKRLVTIPTVSLTRTFDLEGRRVGYVYFRNFVTPSTEALNVAFSQLRDSGANELVLDVRYNGGGLVSVAQHLGGLIGGSRTTGQVFAEFFHNDKQRGRNQTLRFEDKPLALDLSRLTVITTRSSASASELVINALRPFMPVTVVGDTTYGKPVGQYGFNFCDKVLAPVSFQLRNARGEGDFFSGIPPDCAAADDADHLLGDPQEASLGEALFFLKNGRCSAAAASAQTARALRAARAEPRAQGWQSLVNVY
jgi:C-terminal processing protease CtpA/Prc